MEKHPPRATFSSDTEEEKRRTRKTEHENAAVLQPLSPLYKLVCLKELVSREISQWFLKFTETSKSKNQLFVHEQLLAARGQ